MVDTTPRPLYPREWPGTYCGWATRPVWTGAENLASTGIRSPDRRARTKSLYRLSCRTCWQIYYLSSCRMLRSVCGCEDLDVSENYIGFVFSVSLTMLWNFGKRTAKDTASRLGRTGSWLLLVQNTAISFWKNNKIMTFYILASSTDIFGSVDESLYTKFGRVWTLITNWWTGGGDGMCIAFRYWAKLFSVGRGERFPDFTLFFCCCCSYWKCLILSCLARQSVKSKSVQTVSGSFL